MVQQLIVIGIGILVFAIVIRNLMAKPKKETPHCNGCSGCDLKNSCNLPLNKDKTDDM